MEDFFKEIGVVSFSRLKCFLEDEISPVAVHLLNIIDESYVGEQGESKLLTSEIIIEALDDFLNLYPQFHCATVIDKDDDSFLIINKFEYRKSISFYICNGDSDESLFRLVTKD